MHKCFGTQMQGSMYYVLSPVFGDQNTALVERGCKKICFASVHVYVCTVESQLNFTILKAVKMHKII